MAAKSLPRYVPLLLGKGLLASLVLIIGTVLGSLVTTAFRLPAPQMPAAVNPGIVTLLMVPSGMLMAIALGELFKRLPFKFRSRVAGIFVYYYLVACLLQTLEAVMFTRYTNFAYGAVSQFVPALLFAWIIALLWKPKETNASLVKPVVRLFSERAGGEWVWRLLLAWLIYVPVYYGMGRIVSPFTAPFYLNPDLNLGIVLPNPIHMIDMQFLRGALYVLAALPIIAAWPHGKGNLWFWLGLTLFLQVSVVPLIQGYWYPWGMKLPHAFELLAGSFVQAYFYVHLFGNNNRFVTIKRGGSAGAKAANNMYPSGRR